MFPFMSRWLQRIKMKQASHNSHRTLWLCLLASLALFNLGQQREAGCFFKISPPTLTLDPRDKDQYLIVEDYSSLENLRLQPPPYCSPAGTATFNLTGSRITITPSGPTARGKCAVYVQDAEPDKDPASTSAEVTIQKEPLYATYYDTSSVMYRPQPLEGMSLSPGSVITIVISGGKPPYNESSSNPAVLTVALKTVEEDRYTFIVTAVKKGIASARFTDSLDPKEKLSILYNVK
jgi:hypothetical protein